MTVLRKIEQEVLQIKERNQRVEADKAWETSLERKVLIALLTYFVVVLFFWIAGLSKPFVNALVPTIGFVLSTLTLSFAEKWWIKRRKLE
ncbi:hypothetical protein HYX13_01165 [Candidatus Woesearchaeota archaeon]|nr:hypothetical protein [Candidatus Woesearchaeota archaeon]